MWKRFIIALVVVASVTACSQHAVMQSVRSSSPAAVVQPFNLSRSHVIAHHHLPSPSSAPSRVTLAADHNIWFNELNYSKIGKITPDGAITEYTLPSGHFASSIAAGPSSTVWFTENGVGFIGKITTGGALTEYPLPSNSFSEGIVEGSDGNMWFTDDGNNAVGRITPVGTVTEFTLPQANRHPYDITAGPDGNLWFTDMSVGAVGKVTTAGAITEFPGPGDTAREITAGPDGDLYAASDNGIWQITTAGAVKEFTTTDTSWWHITVGPDKQIWMTSPGFGALIEFNPKTDTFSSAVQADIESGSPGQVSGLAVGADGDVWIAGTTYNDILVYEETIYSIGIRLNGEISFMDPNYGFELGYALGKGTQTQTISMAMGESVRFTNLDTVPHSAAFLGDATQSSAPWPQSFDGSTKRSRAGTAIGTNGFATGSLDPGKSSPVYETGLPGFYMFGCQYHYNTNKMRTVLIVH